MFLCLIGVVCLSELGLFALCMSAGVAHGGRCTLVAARCHGVTVTWPPAHPACGAILRAIILVWDVSEGEVGAGGFVDKRKAEDVRDVVHGA